MSAPDDRAGFYFTVLAGCIFVICAASVAGALYFLVRHVLRGWL